MEATLKRGERRWTVGTCYLLIFCNSLAKTLVLVFLVGLIIEPDSPFVSPETGLGVRHLLYAVLVGISTAVEIVGNPLVGALSDQYGRRRLLLWTTFSGVAAYGLCVVGIYTSSIALVIIGRGLGGLSSANISLSAAAITDVTTEQNRGRYMSMLAVFQGLAWVIGPALGAYLANPDILSWFGPSVPFWLLVALLGVGYLLVLWVVKESHLAVEGAHFRWKELYTSFQEVFRVGDIGTLFLVFTAMVMGQVLFIYFFALYLTERFGLDEVVVANVFAYLALWRLVGGLVANQLFRRFGAVRLAVIPMWALGASCVVFLAFQSQVHLYWIVPIAAASQSIVTACFFTLFGDRIKEQMRGKIFAAINSMVAVVYTVAPFIAGGLALIWIDLPNLAGGLLVFGAAIWYMKTIAFRKSH